MLFILMVGSRHKMGRYLSTGAKRKAVAAPPASEGYQGGVWADDHLLMRLGQ
jgi:hypothetical protein